MSSEAVREAVGPRARLALAAALGTGVVLGAAGLVVYQRMSQNVGLRVTGADFSQELATLTTHIAALRADIEQLKGKEESAAEAKAVLKSALKRDSKYAGQVGNRT